MKKKSTGKSATATAPQAKLEPTKIVAEWKEEPVLDHQKFQVMVNALITERVRPIDEQMEAVFKAAKGMLAEKGVTTLSAGMLIGFGQTSDGSVMVFPVFFKETSVKAGLDLLDAVRASICSAGLVDVLEAKRKREYKGGTWTANYAK